MTATDTNVSTTPAFVVLTSPINVDTRQNSRDMFRVMGPRFDPSVARRPIVAFAASLAEATTIANLLNGSVNAEVS